MRSLPKRGFTLIELLVVIAIIAILASILFPIFAKAREQARKATCINNVKQLATAMVMYAQDNNSQFPGTDGSPWVAKITGYVGNAQGMFSCPSDTTKDAGAVSYGLSGLMLRKDGTGVKDSQVTSPSEVVTIADATPTETYPNGRVIGGGGLLPSATNGAEPAMRHSKGCVAGYADGHAKFWAGPFNALDASNGAVRGLISGLAMGLIDNPVGGMIDTGAGSLALTFGSTVTVGGEDCMKPFIMAPALISGNYFTKGFLGQFYTQGRPSAEYAWGSVSTPGNPAVTAVAFDALIIVAAKGSKIPGIGNITNYAYVKDTVWIRSMFATGYAQNTVQVYAVNPAYSCSTYYGLRNVLNLTACGTDTAYVNDQWEAVTSVANDAYGIAMIGSEAFDPDRVTQIATQRGTTIDYFPSASAKARWTMPALASSTYPFKRSMDVSAPVGSTNALALVAALHGGPIGKSLQAGPLTKWGYWGGNY